MTKATMGKTTTDEIPRQNPCAQFGALIAQPDWIDPGDGRVPRSSMNPL